MQAGSFRDNGKHTEYIGAVYGRVSTNAQENGISLDEQIAKMLSYADTHNIRIPEQYIFRETFSGYKDERPEYEKIRQLIRNGRISVLIVYSNDRFTRDPIVGSIFRNELKRANCTLHFVTDGKVDIYSPQGELINTVKDAFSAYWGQMIKQTTQEKKKAYAQAGIPYVQGQPPFGLKRVGKKGDVRIEFDENAPLVQRIFEMFDKGMKAQEICDVLRGTPTPGDVLGQNYSRGKGIWSVLTIYNILTNEGYRGVQYTNKTTNIDGKRILNPKEEWGEIHFQSLIPEDLFQRVQDRLSRGQREKARPHQKYEYLLARRTDCRHCNMHIAGTTNTDKPSNQYYRCYSVMRSLGNCSLPNMKVRDVDAAVWRWVKDKLQNPQALFDLLTQAQSHVVDQNADLQRQIEDLSALIKQDEAELENVALNLRRMKNPTARFMAMMEAQIEELSNRIDSLSARRGKLQSQLAEVSITPSDFDLIGLYASTVQDQLENASFETQREIIEGLDLHFELAHEDGVRYIYIIWKIWEWREKVIQDLMPSSKR